MRRTPAFLTTAALLCLAAGPALADKIFVSNEKGNTVTVLDAATLEVIQTIEGLQRPRGITASPDGKHIYVCASDDNLVRHFDSSTYEELPSLPSGPDPELFVLHPSGNPLFIANEDDNIVTVVDVNTRQVLAEVPVGVEPEGMGVSPDGKIVDNTSETTNMAHIDTTSFEIVANVLVDSRPVKPYDCHFVMGDFIDRTDFGDAAHLFFTPTGSVESFPLPGGQRRWIVQTDQRLDAAPKGLVSYLTHLRTGINVPSADQVSESVFTPRRFNCDRYYSHRVILCGDAAHGMSPIGGQGMNTGFADAEFLAEVLAKADPLALLPAYNRFRRKAAKSAIFRAEWGMWLGTWRGNARSALRDVILKFLLCQGPVAGRRRATAARRRARRSLSALALS